MKEAPTIRSASPAPIRITYTVRADRRRRRRHLVGHRSPDRRFRAAGTGLGPARPSGIGTSRRVSPLPPSASDGPRSPRAGGIAGRRGDLGRRTQPRHTGKRLMALRQRADLVRPLQREGLSGSRMRCLQDRGIPGSAGRPQGPTRPTSSGLEILRSPGSGSAPADARRRSGRSRRQQPSAPIRRYENTNLHQVWDSGLFRSRYREHGEAELVRDLTALAEQPESLRWTSGRIEVWADESLELGRQAYRIPGTTRSLRSGDEIGRDYEKANLPAAVERLARSGVRLASMLNEIFD